MRHTQLCLTRETMRPYEEFAVVADHELVEKCNNNHNNNNNYNYNNIPYHARENSLPFSYGQIGNTSTPLKKSVGSTRNGDSRSASSSYLDFNARSDTDNILSSHQSPIEPNMIKTQPRLTSPLLVRKTLGSRTPTTANTPNVNTIANTYHYRSIGSDNTSGGKTAPRDDFDQLLREQRERVYSEYQNSRSNRVVPPEPPQRHHRHMFTMPSNVNTNYNNNNNINNNSNSNKFDSNESPASKYNYDIEFNLNLDDIDVDLRQKSFAPHTLRERSSLPRPQPQPQLYRSFDVPDASVSQSVSPAAYASRNYHTISSKETSSATYGERPPLEVTYKQRRVETQYGNGNPALYGSNSYSYSSSNNINSNGYNNNYIANSSSNGNSNSNGNGIGTQHSYNNEHVVTASRTRRDLSPIYATTTKQQLQQQQQQHQHQQQQLRSIRTGDVGTNTTTTTTSITSNRSSELDYPNTPQPAATYMRPETPAFPVTPRTPYLYGVHHQHHHNSTNNSYTNNINNSNNNSNNNNSTPQITTHSPTPARFEGGDFQGYAAETIYNTTQRPRLNSSVSHLSNPELQEVAAHLVKFARNSAKYWYKPNLSREDAIALLINAPPGTFLVRDSTTYKNAYGLVLRVAQPPPGSTSNQPQELVRHFLIEPTQRGVRLKGCANEPVFTSLSALVYEHSINQLALPCLLRIPNEDIVQPMVEQTPAQKQLLAHGAATNVLWLFSCETESLTGEEAIRKAIRQLYAQRPLPTPTEVHFKVTQQGITLTDNTRKKFFRKHYGADIISFCAVDPDNRLWSMENGETEYSHQVGALKKTIFAFVARRSPSSKDNQCHVFCDLAISQPASAIVSFANKTLPTEKQRNFVL